MMRCRLPRLSSAEQSPSEKPVLQTQEHEPPVFTAVPCPLQEKMSLHGANAAFDRGRTYRIAPERAEKVVAALFICAETNAVVKMVQVEVSALKTKPDEMEVRSDTTILLETTCRRQAVKSAAG